MRNRTKFNWLILLSLLLGACRDETDLVPTSDRIFFNTVTYNTKASSFTQDNATNPNPILSMGIFAVSTGSDTYDANIHSVNYLNDIEVKRSSQSSEWNYANPAFWPIGNVTFFGYAPHGKAAIDASGTGAPKLSFQVNDNPANQIDLLVATPAVDKTKTTSAVTMAMRHALTKIGFSARLSHEPTEAEAIDAVQISAIEILGVYGSGKRNMLSSDSWNSLSNLKTGVGDNLYKVSTDKGLKDIELSSTYQNITSPDGFLFMLPQELSGEREGLKAIIRVYVSAKWANPNDPNKDLYFVDPIDFELEMTGLDWQQGDAINYQLYIDIKEHTIKNSKIEAKLVDWDEINLDVDMFSRELNVTRIEANIYGGALTRIHFWSNQPYVWIDSKGRSNENGYPTGTTFTVNDIFRNLALDLTPGVEFNTQYNTYNNVYNLNYDASSGEGYFDVENKTVMSSSDQPYHIFLCAANKEYIDKPLRRSVRLNKIISTSPAANNITTSYVGVFHRGHETGERIITWNKEGDWTAVIETYKSGGEWGDNLFEDYKEVRMDRFISPAQEQGILYTDNPGNAEDYPVYPWNDEFGGVTADGRRWVSGSSKVYLRVGWNSKAPGAPFTHPQNGLDIVGGQNYRNRYALITIRAGKDNPNGNIIQNLYLRQGELADYLMRPDKDGYFPDNTSWRWTIYYPQGNYVYSGGEPETKLRPYAKRIPPYNLSDPGMGVGGTNLSSHNILPVRGGCFTQYPSQAGYLFRFNDKLQAYNPANPDYGTGINNYPGTYSVDNPWVADRDEACPQGYRRPSENHLTATSSFDYTTSEFAQSLYKQPAANKLKNDGGILDGAGLVNSQQGWYADGFFDRLPISKAANVSNGDNPNANTRVSKGGTVAYFGSLYFNTQTQASVFFTHAGDRLTSSGQLEWPGISGLYWTDTQAGAESGGSTNSTVFAWGLDFYTSSNYRFAMTTQGDKGRAHAVRCIAETSVTKSTSGY